MLNEVKFMIVLLYCIPYFPSLPPNLIFPAMSAGDFSRLAITALLCGFISAAKAALYEIAVETRYGSIQGYPAFNSTPPGDLDDWKKITVWKGIPFAATTGGHNRWKAPQPRNPWNDTLDASQWGPVCPSAVNGDTYTIDEDCLNLKWSLPSQTLLPSQYTEVAWDQLASTYFFSVRMPSCFYLRFPSTILHNGLCSNKYGIM